MMLFAAATPISKRAKAPTDTVSVLCNIIRYPDSNVAAIFAVNGNSSFLGPFQKTRTVAPNDWALPIQYSTANLTSTVTPRFVAVDSQGNVWVTLSGSGIAKLGPQGQQLMTVGDPNDPNATVHLEQTYGLAIDQHDNVWVTNILNGSLSKFNSAGVPLSGANGFSTPASASDLTNGALAIDNNGEVWLLTLDGQLCNFNNSGQLLCGKGLYSITTTNSNDRNSLGLAIDPEGRVWFAVHGSAQGTAANPVGAVGMVDPSALNPTVKPITSISNNPLMNPMFLSSNKKGDIWISNQLGYDLIAIDPKAQPFPESPISGGGLCMPRVSMFDGDGELWVGNYTALPADSPPATTSCGNSLSHFDVSRGKVTNSGMGSGGFKGGFAVAGPVGIGDFTEPLGLAIDGSGNIWVADGQSNFITELVGAAAPVVTPLSPAHLGQRP
jgi:sugar lactone lactonase YvrE